MTDTSTRRWLITGASTGFGRTLAEELPARGEKVCGTVRRAEDAAVLEARGIAAVRLDVDHTEAAEPAVAEAIARLSGIDVLVNNAGYGLMGAIGQAV